MREHSQDGFALLRGRVSCGKRRAESALVPGEHALRMPALVIEYLGKGTSHGASVVRFRPAATRIAWIQVDHRLADPQDLATEPVIVFPVVARISEHCIERQGDGRLTYYGSELGRVLRWSDPGHSTHNQVRMRMDHGGELGPRPATMRCAFRLSTTDAVVETHMPGFQTSRVHGSHRGGINQSCAPCTADDNRLCPLKDPPFSASAKSRRSA